MTQGTYNGLVKRSFYPQIFFGGALSAGMSGGPALDEEGHVVGINVARRIDGEQVSFLVPAEFAIALLARGRDAAPLVGPAYAIVDEQLLKHQAALTDRFIQQGWKEATHPRYRVPVPPDVFMRCWGTSTVSNTGGLDFERSDCVMDTRDLRRRLHDRNDQPAPRKLRRHQARAAALRRALLGELSQRSRSSGCRASTRPSRAARRTTSSATACRCAPCVCMRAYKKLPQLYDVAVLVATLDQSETGVQGRFDAQGVSFANAQRLAQPLPRRLPMGAAALGEWPAERPAQRPALLEAVDRDGMVRQAWRIERWPVSIGRALDNEIVLSDPHVAPHHATSTSSAAPTVRRRRSCSPSASRRTVSSSAAASGSRAAPAGRSPTAAATSSCRSAAPSCACACRGMRSGRSSR